MKSAVVAKLSGLAALVLAMGSLACSSDDSGTGGGDADRDRGQVDGNTDAGTDVPELDQGVGDQGGDTDEVCDQIGLGTNLGQTCDPNTQGACGAGGACLTLDGGGATCFQVCVQNQCEAACVGTERCLRLVDENGDPVPLFEGGPDAGVCAEPQAGDQGAYDECGAGVGACEADFDCLILTGIDGAPFCAPRCSSANNTCPSREGTNGQCVLGANPDSPTNCGLLCDEANVGTSTGCPAGTTCTATGQGAGICMFPET